MRRIQSELLLSINHSQAHARTILDIGCGNGLFSRAIAQSFPLASVFAVDPCINVENRQAGGITFMQGSAEQLPFPSGSFEVALACLSFHHWRHKQTGLMEVSRVLKPDGSLFIGDPFFEGIMRNRALAWLVQKTDSGAFSRMSELEALTKSAGLSICATKAVQNFGGALQIVHLQKQFAVD